MDSKSIGLCPQGFESPRCRCTLACLHFVLAGRLPRWAQSVGGYRRFGRCQACSSVACNRPFANAEFRGPQASAASAGLCAPNGPFSWRACESTTRGFEPLRAEPNGFLIHHLSHSVTLSCLFAASPIACQTSRSGHRIQLPGQLRRGRCPDSHQELAGTSESPSIACVRHTQFGPPLAKPSLARAPAPWTQPAR